MNLWWVLVIPAYLLGTFPSAILVGRRAGRDVTAEGSGNPGASNAYRTMGRRAGVTVLGADLCKGVLAAGLGLATGDRGVAVACGLAAVLGHVLPATRGWRGGKGVATAAGVTLVLLPFVGAALGVAWGVVLRLTRTASAASIVVAALLPVGAFATGRPPSEVAAFAACGALVVLRHRSNIDRMLRGEERAIVAGGRPLDVD